MNDMERLYCAQAVMKMVAGETKTGNPDNLRGRCDAEMVERYHATGAKSYDALLNGQKVGTYGVAVRHVKESRTAEMRPTDEAAFVTWLFDDPDGNAWLMKFLDGGAADLMQVYFEETGEVPPGAELVEHVKPAHDEVAGTTLRVDERKVADAYGAGLPAAVAGLLAGEPDD